jgi:hypothetical protein
LCSAAKNWKDGYAQKLPPHFQQKLPWLFEEIKQQYRRSYRETFGALDQLMLGVKK